MAEKIETTDDLVERFQQDKGLTLTFTSTWEKTTELMKHMDAESAKILADIRARGGRPENLFTKESTIDKMAWRGPGDANNKLTLQALASPGGPAVGEEIEVRPENTEFTYAVGGVFWPAEARDSLLFLMPEGRFIVIDLLRGIKDIEEWRGVVIALVQRNHRMRAPLFSHPCPECGQYFKPKRRGQLYDKRTCAHKTGERRRYQEKKDSMPQRGGEELAPGT